MKIIFKMTFVDLRIFMIFHIAARADFAISYAICFKCKIYTFWSYYWPTTLLKGCKRHKNNNCFSFGNKEGSVVEIITAHQSRVLGIPIRQRNVYTKSNQKSGFS